jgi:hypothetical protein
VRHRHTQLALPEFNLTNTSFVESHPGMFIRDPSSGKLCVQKHGEVPFWDFSKPAAVEYWVNTVVRHVAQQPHTKAVFFDTVDSCFCGYKFTTMSNCTITLTKPQLHTVMEQKAKVMAAAIRLLNANGKIPILSLTNYFGDSSGDCIVDESVFVGYFNGTQWLRFYEYFGSSYVYVANMVKEASWGIPAVVHPVKSRGVGFPLASFLIGQSENSYFGFSSDWYDDGWAWAKEYDVAYGKPLGLAVQVTHKVWERNFTGCHVHVDAGAYIYKITPMTTPI